VALTDESHPFFLAGAFQASLDLVKSEAKIGEAFRTGTGLSWGEHDAELFPGAERVWKPGYQAYLVSSWIPALEGVEAKLRSGARVADVGCGHGASTLILAEAYPNSKVVGYDNHAPSIEHARRAAVVAGLGDRVTFEVAGATSFPGHDYDLVAFFDSFHDLGDPLGAARQVRSALAPEGTLMLVEPMAGQRVEEGALLHPQRDRAMRLPGGSRHHRQRRGPPGRSDPRRLHPLPPRRPGALQPDLRGPAVVTRPGAGRNLSGRPPHV
jgi:SAM-dependent methyltransferase